MKTNITLFLAVVAVFLSGWALYNSKTPATAGNAASHFPKKAEVVEEEIEIADLMLYVQHFHHKVYLAAKAGNNTLTRFYLEEMGEKMNTISKAQIWSNGVNISENMRIYGLKQVDTFLEKDAAWAYQNFDNLTQACNSCHQASKHPDIKIKTPVNGEFPNQDFTP